LSTTGSFTGEEIVVYDTGSEYGPRESPNGDAHTIPMTLARYVRHWCGRSTSNAWVHFMEMDIYGDPNPQPRPPAQASAGAFRYLGCFNDNNGRRDLTGSGPDAVASDPLNAAEECASFCDGYTYFGLQYTNECFCGNSYGSQGVADETDCDADGSITDGVADLCANGAGDCGNRNAVYKRNGNLAAKRCQPGPARRSDCHCWTRSG